MELVSRLIVQIEISQLLVYTLPRKKLPEDRDSLPPSESTQNMGRKWIQQARHAIFKVPSTVIREEYHYLINPAHPDFYAIEIGKPQRFEFDERLIE